MASSMSNGAQHYHNVEIQRQSGEYDREYVHANVSLQTCTMTTRNVPSIRRMRGILSKPVNTLDLCLYSVC
jgi:hypothetical protein